MSTREELEAQLNESMDFSGMMKNMMETRNSMLNLEMVEGTPITVNTSTIDMLKEEFIAKLRVLLPDEEFKVYTAAMVEHAPKIVEALDHISEVIAAQMESSNNVQM